MKKCKNCKTKFETVRPLQFICSANCAFEYVKKQAEKKRLIDKKEEKKVFALRKVKAHEKKHKNSLQNEINKLARIIDAKFWNCCIDCKLPFRPETQQHGAHYHDIGGHNSIRFNLHNIHSSTSQCNLYSNKHKSGYKIGLIERYGNDYYEMIESLPGKYLRIKLSSLEIYEKLKIVRKLVRDFETFNFENAINARNQLNKIIGIYE